MPYVEEIREHLARKPDDEVRSWANAMGILVESRNIEEVRADLEQRMVGARLRVNSALAQAVKADAITGQPRLAVDVRASLEPPDVRDDDLARLWIAIRMHSDAISFSRFNEFMTRVLAGKEPTDIAKDLTDAATKLKRRFPVPGTGLYDLLRTAAETFLLLEVGTVPDQKNRWQSLRIQAPRDADGETEVGSDVLRKYALLSAEPFDLKNAETKLTEYLGSDKTNYVRAIVRNVFADGDATSSTLSPLFREFASAPFLIELIWSYWIEESMLCQATNALTQRFQNVHRRSGPDPLAELELDPLRPLSGVLWGHIQNQHLRLTVARRAYEYMHEYNFPLHGAAVGSGRAADPRPNFIEAFHSLLRECDLFMKQDNDVTIRADAFPVLNALKQVHLNLTEGGHNQFRDLPWTARAEMLVEQWVFAQPEIREFLRGRYSVSYPEDWMGSVDAMKRVQGWGGASSIHFGTLAKFGERLLLSIRHYLWNSIDDPQVAHAWVRFWREEIQGYIHAYKAVTGVSLIDAPVVHAGAADDGRYLPPSVHLRKRLLEARSSGD